MSIRNIETLLPPQGGLKDTSRPRRPDLDFENYRTQQRGPGPERLSSSGMLGFTFRAPQQLLRQEKDEPDLSHSATTPRPRSERQHYPRKPDGQGQHLPRHARSDTGEAPGATKTDAPIHPTPWVYSPPVRTSVGAGGTPASGLPACRRPHRHHHFLRETARERFRSSSPTPSRGTKRTRLPEPSSRRVNDRGQWTPSPKKKEFSPPGEG